MELILVYLDPKPFTDLQDNSSNQNPKARDKVGDNCAYTRKSTLDHTEEPAVSREGNSTENISSSNVQSSGGMIGEV